MVKSESGKITHIVGIFRQAEQSRGDCLSNYSIMRTCNGDWAEELYSGENNEVEYTIEMDLKILLFFDVWVFWLL